MHSRPYQRKAQRNQAIRQTFPRRHPSEVYDFAARRWGACSVGSIGVFEQVNWAINQLHKLEASGYWCLGSVCRVGQWAREEKLSLPARCVFLLKHEILEGETWRYESDWEINGYVPDLWTAVTNHEMQGDQEWTAELDRQVHNSRIF